MNLYALDKKADIKSKKVWSLFACIKKGCTFAFRKCRKKTVVFLRHFAFIDQRVRADIKEMSAIYNKVY